MTNMTSRHATKFELNTLEEALSRLPIPRKRYLKAALNTAVFWIFLLAAFCILWFVISIVISGLTGLDIGLSSVHANYLFPIMVITAIIVAVNSTKNWLNTTTDEYSLIKMDLMNQKTNVETFQVVKASCFKEPQLGGLLYFLLIQRHDENGLKEKTAIRAIYDYESQNEQIDATQLLTIQKQITITSAPTSNYLFEHQFQGELVKDIVQYDLTVSPERWPEPNAWIDVKWSELPSIYNNNELKEH